MLSKVTDVTKGELENQYNGLGFKVASTRPEEKIEYLCDLSRDCYNLLERKVHHAAIVSDVTNDDILYAGNTKRRFDQSLSDNLGPDGEYGVVVVRINDELER